MAAGKGLRNMRKRGWLGLSAFALLAGCGGGGGVNSTGLPPSGSTTPTRTPSVNYDDAEYERSNAATSANALAAYQNGATGAGVTIAFLDSGLSQVGTEFSGRVSSASTAFGGNTSITDEDGHGTSVAAVAAAGHNGSGIEGVAFGATILALRTDTAGTCGTSGGCKFDTSTLTQALDYARTSGAKIVNMSLGGAAMPDQLVQAVGRATAAGMIVVIAAGNDGTPQPDPFAQVASASEARGLVIIAGSHDATGAISSFSDQAGSFGQYYLTALGENVLTVTNTGQTVLASGTSYATPAVAAAAALLEQAFPNLTPAQVVALLYSSADDAGATGIDSVYGNGLLDLAKAFQPAGTTSLAGTTVAVSASNVSLLSPAMGDATVANAALGRAVVLDSYGRAFAMNLAANVGRQSSPAPLAQALGGDLTTQGTRLPGLALSTTIAHDIAGEPWAGLAQRGRGFTAPIEARALGGSAVSRIDRHTIAGFAYAEGGRALGDQLSPAQAPGSFLAARGPAETPGFPTRAAMSLAVRHLIGRLAVTATAEHGTLAAVSPTDPARPGYTLMTVGADRRLGALFLAADVGGIAEASTLFGARLSPALGRGGSATRFLDLSARLALGGGWSAGAAWRRGWTRAEAGGVLASGSLDSSSAAFDLGRAGRASRFAIRFAMPPRITGGGLDLVIPTSYDYATGTIGHTDARLSLSPAGRERDIEATWGGRLGAGWLDTNLYLRRQPGNIAAAPDDLGAALRYSLSF